MRTHERTLLVVALVLLAAAAACCVLVKTTDVFPVRGLHPWGIRRDIGPRGLALADTLAFPARPPVAVVLVAAGATLAAVRRAWALLALLLLSPLAVLACQLVKADIGRPTPMPSGHAAYGAAVLGALALLALREGRPGLAAVPVVFGVGIGPARVLEGAHWWPDIAVGAAAGLGWLLVLLVATRRAPAVVSSIWCRRL